MLAPPRVTHALAHDLARHYAAVASAVNVPIMIQVAPGYIGVSLGLALIKQIASDYSNIRYLKTEALPAVTAITELRERISHLLQHPLVRLAPG